MQLLVQWYVEANQHACGIEGSIILAHSALDLSSSTFSTEREADKRIRELIKGSNINVGMPRELKNLYAICRGYDIPKTLSMLRNAIVHPSIGSMRISLAQVPFEARKESLELGLWCIERTLLRFFDYKGHYYNWIKRNFGVI